jgi:hypothetical protein
MTRGKLPYIGLSLLIAVATLLLLRTCGRGREQLAADANNLSEAVAHEFGRMVRDKVEAEGRIVLIQVPGFDELGVSMNERTRKAFLRGLGNRAGDVEEIDFEEGRAREEFEALARKIYRGRWGDELTTWMKEHSDAAAVVNLNALPLDLGPKSLDGLPPLFTLLPMIPEDMAQETVSGLGLAAALLPREALTRPGAVPRSGKPDALVNAAYQTLF